MGFVSLFLIALGLSVDCLSISISVSATSTPTKENKKYFVRFALILGLMHGIFALLGWFAGKELEKSFQKYDHWIAFILFAIIGGRFIYHGIKNKKNQFKKNANLENLYICLGLAVATSIDALVVGISINFLNTSLFFSILIISITTFVVSLLGLFSGKHLSPKLKRFPVDVISGIILICIGSYILIEHSILNI